MTTPSAAPGRRSPAARLRDTRAASGLDLAEAASAACLSVDDLSALESGRTRPTAEQLQALGTAYGTDLSDVLLPRRPLVFDAERSDLEIGPLKQRVRDAGREDEVYRAYLALLQGVRGAGRGAQVPLRAADLEVLLSVVGGDADQVERRLVELMGCTTTEASLLRRVLLRHRALVGAVGVAAGLSVVAAVGAASATDPSGPGSAARPAATSSPSPHSSASGPQGGLAEQDGGATSYAPLGGPADGGVSPSPRPAP